MPITEQGLASLKSKLERLTRVERPSVIKAIAAAREHGDLSENAEYHAAREKQSFIEGKIGGLQAKISNAQVIETDKLGGNTIKFGAKVTIDDGSRHIYRLVGDDEADVGNGLLGINSPLAQALVGKAVGEEVKLTTPAGDKTFTVKKIDW